MPDYHLSIIMDGVDLSLFSVPHLVIKVKSDIGWVLKAKLPESLHQTSTNIFFAIIKEHETEETHNFKAHQKYLNSRNVVNFIQMKLCIEVDNCSKRMWKMKTSLTAWNFWCNEIILKNLKSGFYPWNPRTRILIGIYRKLWSTKEQRCF